MSTNTTNYNLVKPGLNETADIEVINQNMDIIDSGLKNVSDKADGKISKSLATAANQFLLSSAVGQFVVKTVDEIKSLLGLGSAAYTNSNTYATAAQGTKADNAATQAALNTHLSDTTTAHGINNKLNVSTYNAHIAVSATEGAQGHVQLATSAEALAGIAAYKAVTPIGLEAKIADYGGIVGKSGSCTIVASDRNKVVYVDSVTASTVTIPANATVAFPVGTQITFLQSNVGTVTFAPASGVVLASKDTKRTIDGLYASSTLIKTSTDTWFLIGALK
ncbi:hypothetical protein [Ruminiclostridium cellobioparum]|uniref:hypothetical protein n=1 Tax=Ruminiclostridium cellobioparum TaxID=29355 RepID=UPI0028A59ED9|nr:hypothetical protein [Ruminiclostridium cellobioparum]